MPMTIPEVISVVNSLDKDQIFRFLKHFVSSKTFPFPRSIIYNCFFSGEMAIKYSW